MGEFYAARFFELTFANYAIWTWILPILIGMSCYRVIPTELRWLVFFSMFSLAFEYFSNMPWAINQFKTPTNYPYYHVVTPIFFGFQIMIFYPVLSKVLSRQWIGWTFITFVLFCLGNTIWGDGIMQFNGNSLALLSISCILLGITFFAYLLRTLTVERVELSSFFWLSVGTIIYYSGSFLLWLAVKYINFNREEFYSIYAIHAALSILLHLCYVAAIWTAVTHQDQDLLTPCTNE